jgi:putative zinc ribbon protein
MKSGKQRRHEIKAARNQRAAKKVAREKKQEPRFRPAFGPPVNEELLAPYNSYVAPDFVRRGYYVDRPFRCVDCGNEEIWTGMQQKWWYEVAKGFVYSSANRCRLCRRKRREESAASRRIHLEGVERKRQARMTTRTEKSS